MRKQGQSRTLNAKAVHLSTNYLRALAHPLRLKIIQLIDEKKSMCVQDIYAILKIEQSLASQHLSILRNVNLVFARRDGKFVHYSVNYERLAQMNEACIKLADFEAPE